MAKICKFDFRRFCLFPAHDSCAIFDPISGVSVCELYRGGDCLTARKSLVVDEPVGLKRLKRGGRCFHG